MTDARTVLPGVAVTYHEPSRESYNGEKLSLATPALARTATAPQLGDAARLISALDRILDLGAAYVDIWERDFPCAPATLRTWAECHGFEVEELPAVLRVANGGRVHICLHREVAK